MTFHMSYFKATVTPVFGFLATPPLGFKADGVLIHNVEANVMYVKYLISGNNASISDNLFYGSVGSLSIYNEFITLFWSNYHVIRNNLFAYISNLRNSLSEIKYCTSWKQISAGRAFLGENHSCTESRLQRNLDVLISLRRSWRRLNTKTSLSSRPLIPFQAQASSNSNLIKTYTVVFFSSLYLIKDWGPKPHFISTSSFVLH